MSYWTYYLAWTFFAYAMREPWLLVGVAAFLVLRKIIPDPGALFRAAGKLRLLRAQVEVNPANVTARRDLATMYLDLRRPGAALALTEQALKRAPDDPEVLYLSGLALQRAGQNEQALGPLVRAVELDPRLRFGQPYCVAGDALFALKRWDAALDAYERYADTNGSDVSAHTRLAKTHARLGDHEASRKAIADALYTWRVLHGGMKRRAFGAYLAAQWARVVLLREPMAIVFVVLAALLSVAVVRAALPVLKNVSMPKQLGHYSELGEE